MYSINYIVPIGEHVKKVEVELLRNTVGDYVTIQIHLLMEITTNTSIQEGIN